MVLIPAAAQSCGGRFELGRHDDPAGRGVAGVECVEPDVASGHVTALGVWLPVFASAAFS